MLPIHPEAQRALDNFHLDEGPIGFGTLMAPVMYRTDYKQGSWGEGRILPHAPIEVSPASKILHYAPSIFEGLKAYHSGVNEVANFFRSEKNRARLNCSAERMCMPALPEQFFNEGINAVTLLCQELIPNQQGQSLYLRPFIFGTEAQLGMGESASYTFLVIASPSEVYHDGEMRVLVERNSCRSVQGGTGTVKAGANYAMSLYSAKQVQLKGFHQSLWLDPKEMHFVEELSGMNLFAVIDGTLVTPQLNDTFLPGITRDSILTLAFHLGYQTSEEPLAIDYLLQSIESGLCSEVFSCGTATIISPICCIGDRGKEYRLPDKYTVANELLDKLLAIQECRQPDPFDWIRLADKSYLP